MIRTRHLHFIMSLILVICLARSGLAATIAIDPQEIKVSDREPFAQVTLFNFGEQDVVLRLGLTDMAMTASGGLTPLTASEMAVKPAPGLDHPFASSFLRVAPRQVTIPPNETHQVRIIAHRTNTLPDGAYHTHLFLKLIPSLQDFEEMQQSLNLTTSDGNSSTEAADNTQAQTTQAQTTQAQTTQAQTSIGIIPIISFAYPVWFNKGNSQDARAFISKPVLVQTDEDERIIQLRIDRSGRGQMKGELRVFVSRAGLGKEVELGDATPVNVYPEASSITTSLTLDSETLAAAGVTAQDLTADRLMKGDISLRVQFTRTVPGDSESPPQSIFVTGQNLTGQNIKE